jgi:hypothetical protein
MRAQVVLAFQRRDDVESQRRARLLLEEVVLAEDLNRPIARAMDADLGAAHQAVTQLEADLGAAVDAEAVAEQITEVALSERPREAVRHAKRQLVARQAKRRRKCRQVEVGLNRIDQDVGIGALGLCGGRRIRRRGRVRGLCASVGREQKDGAGEAEDARHPESGSVLHEVSMR